MKEIDSILQTYSNAVQTAKENDDYFAYETATAGVSAKNANDQINQLVTKIKTLATADNLSIPIPAYNEIPFATPSQSNTMQTCNFTMYPGTVEGSLDCY